MAENEPELQLDPEPIPQRRSRKLTKAQRSARFILAHNVEFLDRGSQEPRTINAVEGSQAGVELHLHLCHTEILIDTRSEAD